MDCYYCTKINKSSSDYPVSEAVFNLETGKPRCSKHWRYRCLICNKYQHFDALGWCRTDNILFCRNCAKKETIVRESYWGFDYYSELTCGCGYVSSNLSRLEFLNSLPEIMTGIDIGPEEFYPDAVGS